MITYNFTFLFFHLFFCVLLLTVSCKECITTASNINVMNQIRCKSQELQWIFSNFQFSLHILTRHGSCVDRLINSMNQACFPNSLSMDLSIWSSQNSITDNFNTWKHGSKKLLYLQGNEESIYELWLLAWTSPLDNEIRIVFDEEIEIAVDLFDYLMIILNRLLNPDLDTVPRQQAENSIFGLSFHPHYLRNIAPGEITDPYLFQMYPLSYASVLFGRQWKSFLKFYYGTGQFDRHAFLNGINLPESILVQSQSSFFQLINTFMFGRALFTLYSSNALIQNDIYSYDMKPIVISDFHDIYRIPVLNCSATKTDLIHETFLSASFLYNIAQTKYSRIVNHWKFVFPQIQANDKFLFYSPQFGLSNQLIALEKAIIVARTMNRILVLPDLYINGKVIPRATIFQDDIGIYVSSGRIISLQSYQALVSSGITSYPSQLFSLSVIDLKQAIPSLNYFKTIGMGNIPVTQTPISLDQASYYKFGKSHIEEKTIAFVSLFASWFDTGTKVEDAYYRNVISSLLSIEKQWIKKLSHDVIASNQLNNDFICAHVRRDDFNLSCALYDEEMRTKSPRVWVKRLYSKRKSCWVDETVLFNTISIVRTHLNMGKDLDKKLNVYVSTDDNEFISQLSVESQRLHGATFVMLPTLLSMKEFIRGSFSHPLIDQNVCSGAKLLILNSFSTFSAKIYEKAKRKNPKIEAIAWTTSNEIIPF